MNKSDLVDALAARNKISKAESGRVVDALFSPSGIIAGSLKKGNLRSMGETSGDAPGVRAPRGCG